MFRRLGGLLAIIICAVSKRPSLGTSPSKTGGGGGGVILGILYGDVPPGSPNPDPISDQKMLLLTKQYLD